MKEGRRVASFGLRRVGWMLYGLLKLFLARAERPCRGLQVAPKAGSVDRVAAVCVCVDLHSPFTSWGASCLCYKPDGIGLTLWVLTS